MEINYLLYGLYDPNDKNLKYVGITVRSLNERLNDHCKQPTNPRMKKWIDNLKNENKRPKIELIKKYENYEELLISEKNEILKQRNNGIDLYNFSDGGDINPMFGKTHTKEAREKISKIQKNRKRTKEEIDNLKEKNKLFWSNDKNKIKYKGDIITIGEYKKILSKIMSDKDLKGNFHPNFTFKGCNHTDEMKKKLSLKFKGREGHKHTEETKKIMSEKRRGKPSYWRGKKIPKEYIQKRNVTIEKNCTFKGKNNPNFKFDIKKEDLHRLFIIENKTIREISKIYGCTDVTISNNLRKYRINKEKSNIYSFDVDHIKKLLSMGKKQKDIAKIYNCSPKYMNKFIHKKILNV